MVNYGKGSYIVQDATGQVIGRIDGDEYVRNGTKLLYRIEEDEFYLVNGGLVGSIDYGTVHSTEGELLFRITED